MMLVNDVGLGGLTQAMCIAIHSLPHFNLVELTQPHFHHWEQPRSKICYTIYIGGDFFLRADAFIDPS